MKYGLYMNFKPPTKWDAHASMNDPNVFQWAMGFSYL